MTLVQSEPKSIKIWTTAIKKVMLGSTQIRPAWWTPWANTILYYSFDGNVNDLSWNWYNGTWHNGWHYSTWIGWQQCWDFSRANNDRVTATVNVEPSTVMFFMKWKDLNATSQDRRQIIGQTSNWWNSWCFRAIPTSLNASTIRWYWTFFTSWWQKEYTNTSIVDLNRHHFCLTTDGSNTYLYFDGNLVSQRSWKLSINSTKLVISRVDGSNEYALNGYMQHLIIENIQWTQQNIQDYLSNFSY